MIHLTTVGSAAEAEDLQLRFDASGVPVFIEHDYKQETRFPAGTQGFRVHIFVDEQLVEAKRLLADADYQVFKPLDCQAFYAALSQEESAQRARVPDQVDRTLNWLFGAGVLGALAWGAWSIANAG